MFALDCRGNVFVEYLILVALLGLGLFAGLRKLDGGVGGTAAQDGRSLIAMSSMTSTSGGPEAPSLPGDSEAPSLPDQGSPAQAEPSLFQRLGSSVLHALSDGYNAASALIPDPIKPLIRGANDLALGLLFDGADKLLPDFAKDGLLSGAEQLVSGLDRVADRLNAPAPLRRFLDKLTDFNFQAFRNTDGLHGDWYRLYKVWLTESRPSDLGVWDKHDGRDRVTITDSSYTDDLRSRPQNQDAIDKFFAEHPDPQVGDWSTDLFEYTGPDSAEGGGYTALESFAGSYQTKVTYLGRDGNGEPLFRVEVTNESHWQSGTRVPASGQSLTGGRDYLVPDTNRDRGLGIGGDFDQRFIWTQTGQPSAP